ncbi:MAG: hypothetical protein KGZ40_02935 [Clostridiales bacterium]|nr:hypothetical protein [Clostridiales bacterium]
MKRIVVLMTVAAVCVAMVVPVAALGRGGPPEGKGPAYAPGQIKKSGGELPGRGDAARDAESELEIPDAAETTDAAETPDVKKRKGGKPASSQAATDIPDPATGPGDPDDSEVETGTPVPDVDADEPTGSGKRHGIENALSRILINIERAEAQIEAGTRSYVPPGLLRVMAKFLGWLGLDAAPDPGSGDPAPEVPGEPADGGDGDGGSVDDTPTVEPPYSDEETGTVDPLPAG